MQMLFAVCAAVVVLAGCAVTPTKAAEEPAPRVFSGLCALKPVGRTPEGLMFVLAHCEEAK